MKIRFPLPTVFIIVLAACTTFQVEDVPGGPDLLSAASVLFDLKEKGELPGITPEDRGRLRSLPIEEDQAVEGIFEMTFRVDVRGKEDTVFWYRLARPTTEDEWELVESWQTSRDQDDV